MAITVETLDKLERRITLSLAADALKNEVDARLKKLARTTKADGFRPGKVPMNIVAQRYGYSVQYEVINDQLGQAFAKAAAEAQLRVAGQPRIAEKEGGPVEGQLQFDATFEVYPEVTIGDLAGAEVERVTAEVNDAAIDRTVEILRKQRRTFAQRPATEGAADGDRVTIDFEGKIDGVPFDGGKAEGFQFLVGEGQMLEAFEKAVRGMKTGESKTFPLAFPEDYHGKDVAGKEADFLVTVKKVEQQNLPELTEDFIKTLGLAEGTVDALRADVKRNLEREVKFRVLARNKASVMEALLKLVDFDLPQSPGGGRDRPHGRSCSRRPEGPWHPRRRQGPDPGRNVQAPGRAPRAPGPDRGRTGQGQQPGRQAGATPGPHPGTGSELRAACPSGGLVHERPPAHGRSRSRRHRRQRG